MKIINRPTNKFTRLTKIISRPIKIISRPINKKSRREKDYCTPAFGTNEPSFI
jgi:hypothetical protein